MEESDTSFTKKQFIALLFLAIILILVTIATVLFIIYIGRKENSAKKVIETLNTIDFVKYPNIETETASFILNKDTILDLDPNFALYGEDLPGFVKVETDKLILSPKKNDYGKHTIHFQNILDKNQFKRLNIDITLPPIDQDSLVGELLKSLGSKQSDFGIYIYDLNRNIEIGINEGTIFPSASIAKIPTAVLVLRDVEAGKYSMDYKLKITEKNRFASIGEIGEKPNGTEFSIEELLYHLITYSDNNAWHILIEHLGGSYQVVNPRTIEELGVNPYFLDPYQATARNVGKVFRDVYTNETLNKESADYLINLLKNVTEDAKVGIGYGLPSNVEYANKIGFTNNGTDLNYQDSAYVFGVNTDYIVVILDRNIDWTTGYLKLIELSKIIYKYMDTN